MENIPLQVIIKREKMFQTSHHYKFEKNFFKFFNVRHKVESILLCFQSTFYTVGFLFSKVHFANIKDMSLVVSEPVSTRCIPKHIRSKNKSIINRICEGPGKKRSFSQLEEAPKEVQHKKQKLLNTFSTSDSLCELPVFLNRNESERIHVCQDQKRVMGPCLPRIAQPSNVSLLLFFFLSPFLFLLSSSFPIKISSQVVCYKKKKKVYVSVYKAAMIDLTSLSENEDSNPYTNTNADANPNGHTVAQMLNDDDSDAIESKEMPPSSGDGKKEKKKLYDNVYIFTDERCLLHQVHDSVEKEKFNESPERLLELIKMTHEHKWSSTCHYLDCLPFPVPTVCLFVCFFLFVCFACRDLQYVHAHTYTYAELRNCAYA
ncbi:hypothetical protein RFI_13374 [Reticulomyxa filosa]|uniref:Uncharacterized protein n=1 Tax=Reticulomyxa filosa TaxID=46433 RepID=X6NBX8_RETFI|nr:hypothetical protein RFI_13374 [Reticulomyxa filosa]|eukprot:ETO23800.1 hypothetical protein RFI_13374 [Reticulomyxa filosa]